MPVEGQVYPTSLLALMLHHQLSRLKLSLLALLAHVSFAVP
jgi:hypothetical protein